MKKAIETIHFTSSGFGVSGAVIARKNLVSKIDNDFMKADFGLYIKALPNRDIGPNISPMNAILTLNDLRTLRSKIDMMSRSSMKVAKFLQDHKHVEQVDYLGLESHPLHELANKYLHLVDMNKQKEVEGQVSQYIQQNISFLFFEVEHKELRLELESKLISTFSLCSDCSPSDNWLGLSSPKEKIRESGLWLVNQLYKEPLSVNDYDNLKSLLACRD